MAGLIVSIAALAGFVLFGLLLGHVFQRCDQEVRETRERDGR